MKWRKETIEAFRHEHEKYEQLLFGKKNLVAELNVCLWVCM